MRKSDYDSIFNEIYKKDKKMKEDIISYKEIKKMLCDIRKNKAKTTKKYSKEREVAELYALATGIIACAMHFSADSMKEKYKKDNTVYFSLLTNMSNDILGIINLIDNGFEFQAKILIRNLMELMYTLLVTMINEEKRIEYFESADLGNSYAVWQKNFKMSKLNEELAKYEETVFDKELQQEMKEQRRNMYQYYSSYVHNDFLSMVMGCHSIDKKDNPDDSEFYYNLWGMYNNESKEILETVNKLIWIHLMYFRYIISKSVYYNRSNYISKENISLWNSGFLIIFMIEKMLKRIYKN